MLIDMNIPLQTFDTEEEKKNFKDPSGVFTACKAAVQCLLTEQQGEKLGGAEKYARYQLALKIDNAGKANTAVELNDTEVNMIKKSAAMFPPLILGRLYDHLQNKAS